MVATATDAARFSDAVFRARRVLRPATLKTMVAAGDRTDHYGLGTEHYNVGTGKGRWQGHAGAYGGTTSMAATDLESGLTIAVLSNGLRTEPFRSPASEVWLRLALTLGIVPASVGQSG